MSKVSTNELTLYAWGALVLILIEPFLRGSEAFIVIWRMIAYPWLAFGALRLFQALKS